MADLAARKSPGPWKRRVVVMVRAPVAGAVKTRLARDIGTAKATSAYRHTSRNVAERLARDVRWETWLAVTPDHALAVTNWTNSIPRRPQGAGSLGARMQRVFDTMPPGPTVIIGTDIPEINPQRIADAFRALDAADIVFGPADDGGYWLIGLARTRRMPRLFTNVRWSSEHTLADTQANVAGQRCVHIETLDDVDDATAYASIGALGGRRILPVRGRIDSSPEPSGKHRPEAQRNRAPETACDTP